MSFYPTPLRLRRWRPSATPIYRSERASKHCESWLTSPKLAEHRAEIEKLRIGRGELPDDYYCSITCEVMSDPVMAADGYSYERVAIEQWLATGAGTSPKTNELLENEKLLPNKALKALIADELERRARTRPG